MSEPRQRFGHHLAAAALAGTLLAAGACQRGAAPAPAPAAVIKVAADASPSLFQEMTQDSGIAFAYRNGEEAGLLTMLESLGGGAALLDYDGDGRLDVFLTGGGFFAGPDQRHIHGHPSRLYRNRGGWKFQDVTAAAGLDRPLFYTHGCAVADYDGDGWPDLLVTGWGRLALYHNEPDGKGGRRFAEVTRRAGLTDTLWSSSAGFADLDGDGFPDLYVCHYVDWSFHNNPPCEGYGVAVARDICPPKQFNGLPHTLYRNNGDGTFTDVSKSAGLRGPRAEKDYEQLKGLSADACQELRRADADKDYGKGLGVLLVDVNLDGKPDIYVANDTTDKLLYVNRSTPGRLLFEEVGLAAGVARSDRGLKNGSMGLDAADYDGSGRPSLWVTNYENERHGLYHNDCAGGRVTFHCATQVAGITAIGLAYVGWGTHFLDVDLDGWQDLFVVNGHVIRFPQGRAPRAQKPVLLRNAGDGRFVDLTRQAGPYCQIAHVGRGAAFGDLDNDGRIDVVISNINEPVALLRGVGGEGRHWLGIELEAKGHRDLVGAVLTLEAGGRRQTRFAKGGGSYASANDPRHVFGLGQTDKIDKLTVKWPSGQVQEWKGLAVDQYWRLAEDAKDARP